MRLSRFLLMSIFIGFLGCAVNPKENKEDKKKEVKLIRNYDLWDVARPGDRP